MSVAWAFDFTCLGCWELLVCISGVLCVGIVEFATVRDGARR